MKNNDRNTSKECKKENMQETRQKLCNDRRQRNSALSVCIWIGVLILVFLLFYWLFTVGLLENMIGSFNG